VRPYRSARPWITLLRLLMPPVSVAPCILADCARCIAGPTTFCSSDAKGPQADSCTTATSTRERFPLCRAVLVGRLETLRPRLLTRYRERYLQEQVTQWRDMASGFESEGIALADELREVYAAAVGKLVDAFSRIADYKKRRDALYS
jgi:hypothetical protein